MMSMYSWMYTLSLAGESTSVIAAPLRPEKRTEVSLHSRQSELHRAVSTFVRL